MSLFRKLFGGGLGKSGADNEGAILAEEEYAGFLVRAIEMKAGSEYQLCGEIVRQSSQNTDPQVHKFIRADRLATADLAKEATIAKGRQIIDEQGKTLFS